VYRGNVAAQKNPINLATYVALFPQLIAGPIVRYSDVALQLTKRTHSFDKTAEGIRRFIIGFSKKILIANTLGELGKGFMQSTDLSVLYYWLYAFSYMLQIYFDFSGYSDMAIGLGRIFGFKFMENFNYPYISKSVTEFWRRWHISLSSWFRDYVYIPLGGNRVSKLKWVRNILVVWGLTGFWHGAGWNFIFWGLLFAVILILEKTLLKSFVEKCPQIITRIYVAIIILVSWVLFDAPTIQVAVQRLMSMFGANELPLISTETIYYIVSYASIFVLGFIAATPVVKQLILKAKGNTKLNKIINVFEPIVLMALFVLCTSYLIDGSFNPFLYFRF